MRDAPTRSPRTVTPEHIAKHIAYACRNGETGNTRKVSFLIGAGFSRSAGIPTAGEIVASTLRAHPLIEGLERCPDGQSEYAFLMSNLPPVERTKIIRAAIDKATDPKTKRLKINWAHLLLAALVNANYINQILTTNFDPLMVDALAVTGQPVRTFDLTAAAGFQPGLIDSSAVIYLHGQAHGLWLSNTEPEMERVRSHLPSVFCDALLGSTLIVVGYSGEHDPVLDSLAKIPQFPGRLYWVHYGTNNPCEAAMAILEDHAKEAFLVRDHDADSFMRELVLEGLKIEQPKIVSDPIEAITASLKSIMAFPQRSDIPKQSDPVEAALRSLEKARPAPSKPGPGGGEAEKPQMRTAIQIAIAGATRDLRKLEELSVEIGKDAPEEIKRRLGDSLMATASSLIRAGKLGAASSALKEARRLGTSSPEWEELTGAELLRGRALAATGGEADGLFKEAYEKYQAAVKIKPDFHAALNNWGSALSERAKSKSGEEAERLFKEAYERYQAAVQIEPDDYGTLSNWGTALSGHAKSKSGEEAERLFKEAYEKYRAAVQVKPDGHTALFNWGNTLSDHAKSKSGEEADRLFREAHEKYQAAVQVKPDDYKTLSNWGTALSGHAKSKSGQEADKLFKEAYEKYRAAVQIKPDDYKTLSNWGGALSDQAKSKGGEEADGLFKEAYEKYQAAVRIKPDYHDALSNWGTALSEQAKSRSGEEADRLFREAYEKFQAAVRIKPDYHEALSNWGTVLSDQARSKSGEEADRLFREAYEKFQAAVQIKPDDQRALNNWGAALSEQARGKGGEEADRLFKEAYEKYQAAAQIKPDNCEALRNWGAALTYQAKGRSGEEADRLLKKAYDRFQLGMMVAPSDETLHYNMACLAALRNDVGGCLQRLVDWRKYAPHPTRKNLDDADFDPVRMDPRFQEFYLSLPG